MLNKTIVWFCVNFAFYHMHNTNNVYVTSMLRETISSWCITFAKLEELNLFAMQWTEFPIALSTHKCEKHYVLVKLLRC